MYLPHTSLKGVDVQWLIASRGEALYLSENVAAAPFGIGKQPGGDLLPLSFKGVFVGGPPAQDAFSWLLLSVQGAEQILCVIIYGSQENGGNVVKQLAFFLRYSLLLTPMYNSLLNNRDGILERRNTCLTCFFPQPVL